MTALPFDLTFVTGAPRTGTTYLSDWITESPDAYCAHEILSDVRGMSDEEILDYLRRCAATGVDRTSKVLQHEFLRWKEPKTKTDPKLLGFKQPVVWPAAPGETPYAAGEFLGKFDTLYVVAVRHPYDVIASGKHRALHTRNWPGFTTEEHCRLWLSAAAARRSYAERGFRVLDVRWERLVLDFEGTKAALEGFLGVELPVFHGYEITAEYMRSLRPRVSLEGGLLSGSKRELLTPPDLEVIRSLTAEQCALLGYEL